MNKVNKKLNISTSVLTVLCGAVIIIAAIVERFANISIFSFPIKIVIGLCFILFAAFIIRLDYYEKVITALRSEIEKCAKEKEIGKKAKHIKETEYDIIECDERECLNNQSGYCSLLVPEFDSENNCLSAKVGDR